MADIRPQMERSALHKRRAEAHELASPDDLAWAIVMRFYAAMHLTEAYLRTKDPRFHSNDHGARWRAIKSATELNARFRAAYRSLHQLSEDVRYSTTYLVTADAVALSRDCLRLIEAFLEPKLARKAVEPGESEG